MENLSVSRDVNVDYSEASSPIKLTPIFNNVLVKVVSEPINTMSLVGAGDKLNVEFKEFIVEAIGETVKVVQPGDRIVVDKFISDPSRIGDYIIASKYNSESVYSKTNLIKSLKNKDYQDFIKNNPTIDTYEYIIIPEINIICIIK